MGFFDRRTFRLQEPPEHPPRPEWFGPPEGVLPGFSSQRAVLIKTTDIVLVAHRFAVYPNGFTFDLLALLRNTESNDLPWEFHYHKDMTDFPETLLRLGIAFSDGSSWSNLDGWERTDPSTPPPSPFVTGHGGGGGGGKWHQEYWVWPLPPEGPLEFFVSWPSEGIEEMP